MTGNLSVLTLIFGFVFAAAPLFNTSVVEVSWVIGIISYVLFMVISMIRLKIEGHHKRWRFECIRNMVIATVFILALIYMQTLHVNFCEENIRSMICNKVI